MNPALKFYVIGLPVSLTLRSRAAFVSDASHFCSARVPVLIHRLVSSCAAVGQFVELTDGPAKSKRPKRLPLNVGQDRLAASEWMPCSIRREVRRVGRVT